MDGFERREGRDDNTPCGKSFEGFPIVLNHNFIDDPFSSFGYFQLQMSSLEADKNVIFGKKAPRRR